MQVYSVFDIWIMQSKSFHFRCRCLYSLLDYFFRVFKSRKKATVSQWLNILVVFVLQLLKGEKIIIVAFQVFYFPNTSAFPFPTVKGGIVDSHQGVEP